MISLPDIILRNSTAIAIGLGIGLIYILLYYAYSIILNSDSRRSKAMEELKSLLIIIAIIGLIISIDKIYITALSFYLNVNLQSGDQVRLAEAIVLKDIEKAKSALFATYVAEFFFNYFSSIQIPNLVPLNALKVFPIGLGKSHSPIAKTVNQMDNLVAYEPLTNQYTFSPFGFLTNLVNVQYEISRSLFLVISGFFVKYTIISMGDLIASIFVPLGLMLIFLPLTRKAGLTILGMALTFYYIFPFSVIFVDRMLNSVYYLDAEKLTSFLSPNVASFITPNQNIPSIFLARERGYKNIVDNQTVPSMPNKTSNASLAVRQVTVSQAVDAYIAYKDYCANNSDPKCAEIRDYTMGNFRTDVMTAPAMSVSFNIFKYNTLGKISAGIADLAGSFPILITRVISILASLITGYIYLSMLLPIPGSVVPYIPFFAFKALLTTIIMSYIIMIHLVLSLLFDLFIVITGYRAIASVIGAEQSIIGMEKIL